MAKESQHSYFRWMHETLFGHINVRWENIHIPDGSLKPDEVYSLTAFLLYKNGVIQEDEVLAQTTVPQVKMPNRNGYAIPDWKPGMPRPFPNGQ